MEDADEINNITKPLNFPNEFELDENDDIDNLATNLFKMY